jgi:hypothetical protein
MADKNFQLGVAFHFHCEEEEMDTFKNKGNPMVIFGQDWKTWLLNIGIQKYRKHSSEFPQEQNFWKWCTHHKPSHFPL